MHTEKEKITSKFPPIPPIYLFKAEVTKYVV